MSLSTSLKVKISLSVIWFILAILLSLVISSDSYSSNKVVNFIIVLIVASLPVILYWLGIWIWGDGYIWKVFRAPFITHKLPKKLSPESQVYPWRRYFARTIDYWWWGFVLGLLVFTIWPSLAEIPILRNELVLAPIVVFTFIFVESLLLSLFGTTPAKWMLGINVMDATTRQKLSLKQAYQRSAGVWGAGLGFGIPFVNLFYNAASHKKLKVDKTTSWDTQASSVLYVNNLNWLGVFLLITSVCGYAYYVGKTEVNTKNIEAFTNKAVLASTERGEIITKALSKVNTLIGDEFTNGKLSDPNTFLEKRILLTSAALTVDKMYEDLEASYTKLENSIEAKKLPATFSKDLWDAYYPNKSEFLGIVKELVKTQIEAIDIYTKILDFLEKTDYRVVNGQLYFSSDAEVAYYNSLQNRFQKIAQKEQQAIKQVFSN